MFIVHLLDNLRCIQKYTKFTTKYTMYYTKYPVYARIYSIYTASETTKAGSFVSDMYS